MCLQFDPEDVPEARTEREGPPGRGPVKEGANCVRGCFERATCRCGERARGLKDVSGTGAACVRIRASIFQIADFNDFSGLGEESSNNIHNCSNYIRWSLEECNSSIHLVAYRFSRHSAFLNKILNQ